MSNVKRDYSRLQLERDIFISLERIGIVPLGLKAFITLRPGSVRVLQQALTHNIKQPLVIWPFLVRHFFREGILTLCVLLTSKSNTYVDGVLVSLAIFVAFLLCVFFLKTAPQKSADTCKITPEPTRTGTHAPVQNCVSDRLLMVDRNREAK